MYTNYYPSSQLFHGSVPKAMGTRLDALLFGDDADRLESVWQSLVAEVRRLERMMNRFATDSDLYAVNRDGVIYPVGMKDELWDALMDCRRYNSLTEGRFDAALGRWQQVEFDTKAKTVFLRSDAMLDLGGYAKGYALKRVGELLKQHSIDRALVNFGDSSVLALGTHPHGDCWSVGIDNPYDHRRVGEIRLRDTAMSVSGNMPSHTAHIVRPSTGEMVDERRMAVVVAADAVDAEALTTALMVDAAEPESWLRNFAIDEYRIYNC